MVIIIYLEGGIYQTHIHIYTCAHTHISSILETEIHSHVSVNRAQHITALNQMLNLNS